VVNNFSLSRLKSYINLLEFSGSVKSLRKLTKKEAFLYSLSLFVLLAFWIILSGKKPLSVDLLVNNMTFNESIIPFLQFISTITNEIGIGIATVLFFIYLRLKKKPKESWYALLIPIGAIIIKLLKILIARARPESITADLQSFPSGHVTHATIFCVIFYLGIVKDITNKQVKKTFTFIAILLPLIVGLSRLVLNHHWLTDVLGGLLLGVAVVVGGCLYISKSHKIFK